MADDYILVRASLQDKGGSRVDDEARSLSFFSRAEIVDVRLDLLRELKALAEERRENVRYCLHRRADDLLQEMIVLQFRDRFFPPKKHPHKPKSFRVLEGELGLFVFSPNGDVVHAVRLLPDESITFRVGAGLFHADLPLTPIAIHVETTTGPFMGEHDRVLADWAPETGARAELEAYGQRLNAELRAREGDQLCV